MSLKNIVVRCIDFYRNYISQLMLRQCRYHPSCSQYTIDAIKHRGVIYGLLFGMLRILRCNPLFQGGYDPWKKDS